MKKSKLKSTKSKKTIVPLADPTSASSKRLPKKSEDKFWGVRGVSKYHN